MAQIEMDGLTRPDFNSILRSKKIKGN